MATGIDTRTGDYARVNGRLVRDPLNGMQNAVYLRIRVRLGSYFAEPKLGSRLYELAHMKDVKRAQVLAKSYTESALKDLVDSGKITALSVVVSQHERGQILIYGEVTTATGEFFPFQHFVKVG